MGQRAFYFFDPTVLALRLEFEFRRWARRARDGAYRSGDPAFQDFYRRRARNAIESFTALARISTRQEALDPAPLQRLTASITRTLHFYLRVKSRVPSGSRWFGQRLRHKQWFLTSATELMVAGPTMTALTADVVPDREWVEEALTSSLSEVLRSLVVGKKYGDAEEVIVSLASTAEALAKAGQAQLAMKWSKSLVDAVVTVALTEPPADALEERGVVGVLDSVAMLPISVNIGLLKAVVEIDVDALQEELSTAKAIRKTALQRPLPPSVKEHLEAVGEKLEFEAQSEAPVRTPAWFVSETTLNVLGLALESDLRTFLSWAADVADTSTARTLGAGRPVEAAALASRGAELGWRVSGLVGNAHELATAIDARSKLGDDLQRPRWEWDRY